MPDSRLILHVKGTEDQTTELPKDAVRAGIAQGHITRSQLIWSKVHSAWKQVRELPHLLPSQKIAPAPVPRVGGVPPRVMPVVSAQRARVAARAVAQAGSADDLVVHHDHDFHPMKWLCIVLSVLILTFVSANYFLVDRPIVSGLSRTPYANVTVYAHLGAFVQPGALIIHIPPSPALTSANLASFLQALAHSTPTHPVGKEFDDVSLTTGWTGRYSFTGYAWRELGDMTDADDAYKQAFVLDQLKGAAGAPLVSPSGVLDVTAQQAERDKVWADFVAYFSKN